MSGRFADSLDAIRERAAKWAAKGSLKRRARGCTNAGRASRDRQILLKLLDDTTTALEDAILPVDKR